MISYVFLWFSYDLLCFGRHLSDFQSFFDVFSMIFPMIYNHFSNLSDFQQTTTPHPCQYGHRSFWCLVKSDRKMFTFTFTFAWAPNDVDVGSKRCSFCKVLNHTFRRHAKYVFFLKFEDLIDSESFEILSTQLQDSFNMLNQVGLQELSKHTETSRSQHS